MAVRPEGARAPLFCLTRLVLPGFVNKFQTVTVRVGDLRGEIAGVVMQLRPRRVQLGCAGGKGCLMRGADLIFGMGRKTNMNRLRCRKALAQPEEHAAICAKSLQVRVTRWAFPTVIVMACHNSENW